jgi:hypothetical protein
MNELFGIGYLWRHKEQGFRIFIREVHELDGQTVFLIGKIPAPGESPFVRGFDDLMITKRPWTAEDLLREFKPLLTKLRPSALERLLGAEMLDLDDLDDPLV